MTEVSKRRIIYDFTSEIAHDLFIEIYGSYENFINAEYIHPLEEYIITYDESMEDEGIVIAIGERIGFGLDYDETGAYTPADQFYDRCSYTIRHNTSSNILKIMNMDIDEYKEHMKSLGIESTEDMYFDRLNIDSHKYDKKLIKAFLELRESIQNPRERLTFEDEGIVSPTLTVEDVTSSQLEENEIELKEYEDPLEDEAIEIDEIREQINDNLSDDEKNQLELTYEDINDETD